MSDKSFNQKIYANRIGRWIPDLGEDDMKFLCNVSSNTYRSVKSDGCVDNYRISRVLENGETSKEYQEAKENGCCGFIDKVFTNPKTGNKFIIGFNFGH